MPRLSDEELEKIEQRAKAATEGPWFCEPRTTETGLRYQHISAAPDGVADTYHHEAIEIRDAAISGTSSPRHGRLADGQFIASSRTDIPRLVADLKAARKVVEAAKKMRKTWHNPHKDNDSERKCSGCDSEKTLDAALSAYDSGNGLDASGRKEGEMKMASKCDHDNLFFVGKRMKGVICGNEDCQKFWERYRTGTYPNGQMHTVLSSEIEFHKQNLVTRWIKFGKPSGKKVVD